MTARTKKTFRCPCGEPNQNDGRVIFRCEKCRVWQHKSCMGFAENATKAGYFCEKCRPSDHIELTHYAAEGKLDDIIQYRNVKPVRAKSTALKSIASAPEPTREQMIDNCMEIVTTIESIESLWRELFPTMPTQSGQHDTDMIEREMQRAVETMLSHIDIDLLGDFFSKLIRKRFATEAEQMAEVLELRKLVTPQLLGELMGEADQGAHDRVAFYFGVMFP